MPLKELLTDGDRDGIDIQNYCGCIRYTHQNAETAVSKCLSMHLDLLGLDVERSELQEDVLGVDEGRRFLKNDRPLFQPYSKEKAKHCNEVCEPKRSQCGYVSQQQINMVIKHEYNKMFPKILFYQISFLIR